MSPAHDYSLLLDPKTGRYDRVPYPRVVPSPDGRRALVWQGDNSVRYPLRLGVLDRATGSVRWSSFRGGPIENLTADSDGVWSPDGRIVMFTTGEKAPGPGVLILDADTLGGVAQTPGRPDGPSSTIDRLVVVSEFLDNNARGLAAVWTPDGTGLMMPLTRLDGNRHRFTSIGTWDLNGKLRSEVAVSYDADVQATDWFFSPDRSLLAVTGADGIAVFDTRTGALSRTVNPPAGNAVGWRDDGHLLVVDPGHLLHVVSLAGAVVKSVPVANVSPQRYRIGSVTGLPPDAVTL
jgi:hypothetical protein